MIAYAFGSEGRCRPGPATAVPATATAGQGVPLHRRWRGRRPRAMSSRQARRARAPPRLLRRGAGPSPDTRGASPSIMVLACRRGRTGSFRGWVALSPSRGGRVGTCARLDGVGIASPTLPSFRASDLEIWKCRCAATFPVGQSAGKQLSVSGRQPGSCAVFCNRRSGRGASRVGESSRDLAPRSHAIARHPCLNTAHGSVCRRWSVAFVVRVSAITVVGYVCLGFFSKVGCLEWGIRCPNVDDAHFKCFQKKLGGCGAQLPHISRMNVTVAAAEGSFVLPRQRGQSVRRGVKPVL